MTSVYVMNRSVVPDLIGCITDIGLAMQLKPYAVSASASKIAQLEIENTLDDCQLAMPGR